MKIPVPHIKTPEHSQRVPRGFFMRGRVLWRTRLRLP